MGNRSIRYKKEIEHRPTEAIPKRNISPVVTLMSVEMKKPMKAISWRTIESMNILRRPYRSESRGKKSAAKAQPMNMLEPMKPIFCFGTHFKLSASNQL